MLRGKYLFQGRKGQAITGRKPVLQGGLNTSFLSEESGGGRGGGTFNLDDSGLFKTHQTLSRGKLLWRKNLSAGKEKNFFCSRQKLRTCCRPDGQLDRFSETLESPCKRRAVRGREAVGLRRETVDGVKGEKADAHKGPVP